MFASAPKLVVLALLCFCVVLMAETSITFTSPQNGDNVSPCQSIVLSVETSADAGVRHVYFYVNGITKNRDRTAPYEYEWIEVPSGFYQIDAKLVDNNGEEVDAAPVYITVGDNQQANLLTNGDFSCGLKNWTLYTATDVDAEVYIENYQTFSDTSFAYIEVIESYDNLWFVTLYQDFPIYAGHTYQIYFSAEVAEDKMIGLAFQHKNNPWPVRWVNQRIPITPDETEYGPFEFECTEEDKLAQFKFLVGGTNIDIALDNVRVIDPQYISLDVEAPDLSIENFHLDQNYPNPFNPNTNISFTLSRSAAVTLDVFDINGRQVASLISHEQKAAGRHTVVFKATNLPSGLYLYKLQAENHIQTNKMMLIR